MPISECNVYDPPSDELSVYPVETNMVQPHEKPKQAAGGADHEISVHAPRMLWGERTLSHPIITPIGSPLVQTIQSRKSYQCLI